jgi:multicomponent K+:H+ antiporter subunit F
MSLLAICLPLAAAMLVVALLLSAWRLLVGPSAADRILALDTLYMVALALFVLAGMWLGHRLVFELALLIALLGFLGTVVVARFVARGKVVE